MRPLPTVSFTPSNAVCRASSFTLPCARIAAFGSFRSSTMVCVSPASATPTGPANCVGRTLELDRVQVQPRDLQVELAAAAFERAAAGDRRVLSSRTLRSEMVWAAACEPHVRVGVDEREQLLVHRARLRVDDRHRPRHLEGTRLSGRFRLGGLHFGGA